MIYKPVNIGCGQWRIVVRSKAVRSRFEDQAGVEVRGDRIIFATNLMSAVLGALKEKPKRARKRAEQMGLGL
jgi:hypothetical protein